MLITKVKVGQVTNLSEARYCAGMGVDFLSFPIASVDPKTYREITGWVEGPKFGIELNSKNIASVKDYDSDFIAIGTENLDNARDFGNLIVSLRPNEWQGKKKNLLSAKGNILFLELQISSIDDLAVGVIKDIHSDFSILLKAPNKMDIEKLLELPVEGLSFDGAAETKPGLKEYPLSEILEKLEEAD